MNWLIRNRLTSFMKLAGSYPCCVLALNNRLCSELVDFRYLQKLITVCDFKLCCNIIPIVKNLLFQINYWRCLLVFVVVEFVKISSLQLLVFFLNLFSNCIFFVSKCIRLGWCWSLPLTVIVVFRMSCV